MYKRAIVQVWSVDDPEWLCKISEGRAGLAHSRWGTHERHILNTNEFNVRVSVWDLSQTAGVVASLSAPKTPSSSRLVRSRSHRLATRNAGISVRSAPT